MEKGNMKDLFSKCGYNCGHCAAYKENVTTEEDRKRGSNGWKKYYNFRLSIDRMYCDGCQAPDDENPVLLLRGCTIRKCAMLNGAETCAHCSELHTCMHDLHIHFSDINREKIESRLGSPIPEEDYLAFIEPFEHLKHLDEIRSSLNPEDIVNARVSTVKLRMVDFPDDLPFSREELSVFKALHQLLTAIASISGNTYAQQAVLKKRKEHILHLLWTFGLFGEFKGNEPPHLVIDSKTYLSEKLPGSFRIVNLYFEILKEFGVHCEVIPLTKQKYGKKGWLTPMGWLRKEGWLMKLSFDNSAGGVSALKALKSYTAKLNEEYGKKAFGYFKKGDMRVLMKEVK